MKVADLKLTKLANKDWTKELTKAAFIIENAAKRNCPVDTSRLRESITHNINGNEATVGTNVFYAPYVEIGTGIWAGTDIDGIYAEFQGTGRQTPWHYQTDDGKWHTTVGQHPQPFLAPALLDNKDNILEIFKDGVNNP